MTVQRRRVASYGFRLSLAGTLPGARQGTCSRLVLEGEGKGWGDA